ncbi:hypothetical protein I4U23_019607 [Adineta vaga]|nr:hypothetical protein I4U23_019607 [Adineta vaga]
MFLSTVLYKYLKSSEILFLFFPSNQIEMILSSLINFVIILDCIHYSYEFSVQNNYLSRYKRESDLQETADDLHALARVGAKKLNNEVSEEIENDKEAIDKIREKVSKLADKMAESSAQGTSCAAEWREIQDELRSGIKRIIKAYENYIKSHNETCNSIEKFAKDMIDKYDEEKDAIDQMTAPDDTTDLSSASWQSFRTRIPALIKYVRSHEVTLSTAADCTRDLLSQSVQYRQVVMAPPPTTQMRVIHVVQSTGLQAASQRYSIPCNEDNEYNGCQACSNAISDYTRNAAYDACGGCFRITSG